MKKYLFLLIVPVFFISCDKTEVVNVVTNEDIIGYWINPQYGDEGEVTYDRADEFIDGYGIAFFQDGTLLERKNAGWCGTPPITYGDFEGTWSESDEIIDIASTYWGGDVEYSWELISVDAETLIIKILD